jgi:hypothetical protein
MNMFIVKNIYDFLELSNIFSVFTVHPGAIASCEKILSNNFNALEPKHFSIFSIVCRKQASHVKQITET